MDGQGRKIDPAVRLIAGLTLAVFFLRALIPLGYMPDASALNEGRFELIICNSAGVDIVHVIDLDAPDGSGAPKAPAFSDCPYQLSLTQTFAAPDSAIFPVQVSARSAHGFALASRQLVPPSLGPPLGSRAPPIRLG